VYERDPLDSPTGPPQQAYQSHHDEALLQPTGQPVGGRRDNDAGGHNKEREALLVVVQR